MLEIRKEPGFTLVELMIVVAIIGILAAVATPYYARYVQKTRLSSYVFPGVHVIETNISTYYSAHGEFPNSSMIGVFSYEADTTFFSPSWSGDSLRITIQAGPNNELLSLAEDSSNNYFIAEPKTTSGLVSNWTLSGPVALRLGLEGEG